MRLRRVFAFALSGNGDDAPVLARILLGTLFFNRLHIQQRAFDVFSDDRPVYLFFGTVGILHGQYACHEAAHCHGRGACHTQGVPSHAFLAKLDAVCVHPSGERRYYAAFGTEFYGAGSERRPVPAGGGSVVSGEYPVPVADGLDFPLHGNGGAAGSRAEAQGPGGYAVSKSAGYAQDPDGLAA